MKTRTKIILLDIVIVLLYGISGASVAAVSIVAYRARGPTGLVAALLWFGATWANALTPLGLLNFLVLQWFGVRLCKRFEQRLVAIEDIREGELGLIEWQRVFVGYGLLRWIVPLTGWWTDYRYIARKS